MAGLFDAWRVHEAAQRGPFAQENEQLRAALAVARDKFQAIGEWAHVLDPDSDEYKELQRILSAGGEQKCTCDPESIFADVDCPVHDGGGEPAGGENKRNALKRAIKRGGE